MIITIFFQFYFMEGKVKGKAFANASVTAEGVINQQTTKIAMMEEAYQNFLVLVMQVSTTRKGSQICFPIQSTILHGGLYMYF